MTDAAKALEFDKEAVHPIVSVEFRVNEEDQLSMTVLRANDNRMLTSQYEDVAGMLGRLQMVAQGWHKAPPEALENLSRVGEIRERDAKAAAPASYRPAGNGHSGEGWWASVLRKIGR